MSLYNLKTNSDGTYFITKFDEDFNIEACYHLEPKGFSFTCDCPANSRPVVTKPCRHKQMMPNLLPYADTDRFLDYDTGEFCTMLGDPHRVPPEEGEAQPLVGEAVHVEAVADQRRHNQSLDGALECGATKVVGEALGSSVPSPKPYRQQVDELFAPVVVAPAQTLVIRRR